MLGPASFINHSCEPNVEFVCSGTKARTIVKVKALQNIKPGAQLLVKYSDDYFGEGNVDCMCPKCNWTRLMAQMPQPEEGGYELTADLVEELAAASRPAFQEKEADALRSMLEEQLMNQQPVFHEFRSAPVLSDVDTESLESAVPEEVMSVPQEMSVQRLMEMSPGFEAEVLPCLPVFTHNANDEQPGTSDVPHNAPVDTAVAKEKRTKYSQENECIICHVSVVRIDRHLKQVHGDLLTETEQTLIKGYYRFRDSKTVVRFCSTCMRRVASVPTHKSRCPGHLEKLPGFRSVKWVVIGLTLSSSKIYFILCHKNFFKVFPVRNYWSYCVIKNSLIFSSSK